MMPYGEASFVKKGGRRKFSLSFPFTLLRTLLIGQIYKTILYTLDGYSEGQFFEPQVCRLPIFTCKLSNFSSIMVALAGPVLGRFVRAFIIVDILLFPVILVNDNFLHTLD
jgi:hypothetical protein